MERDFLLFWLVIQRVYFNSHAHVERDQVIVLDYDLKCISIHTLTWSVTLLFKWATFSSGISTHTLTWSVTR